MKLVTPASIRYLNAYNWKEQGFLPSPGGWMEQPYKLIEAMNIIGSELAKRDQEQRNNDHQSLRHIAGRK